MTQHDSVFAGSIPEIYDCHLVPLIFQAYADDLAERMGSREPSSVLETAAANGGGTWEGETNLFIRPPYQFQAIDALLTNFHLPKSSLLLLVSALIGRQRLLDHYEQAKAEGYRFFSYGDAMWIPPEAVLAEAQPE